MQVRTMDVRLVTPEGVRRCAAEQLTTALAREDGFVWVDLPVGDPETERVLSDVFGFHPRAVRDCLERNPLPKVHVYRDHVLVVLHAPESGRSGHVHYLELDQLVSSRYLVTVHGPVNPAVDPTAALRETGQVAARLDAGRLRPASPYALSASIVSALTTRMRDHLAERTTDVWRVEQQVTAGQLGDAEQFLDDMFRVRHGLLVVRTMASLSHEIYARMHALDVYGEEGRALLDNSLDQFERLARMARSQEEYLQGVIEFYQTRTNTKMTIAAERLAVIASITLPITALSSVMGMNVIVNTASDPVSITILLSVMATMSVLLLIWAKRRGWW
jgi:magnesium transporter